MTPRPWARLGNILDPDQVDPDLFTSFADPDAEDPGLFSLPDPDPLRARLTNERRLVSLVYKIWQYPILK